MYEYTHDTLQNLGVCLEYDVEEVKIKARYGQQPPDEISDDEY